MAVAEDRVVDDYAVDRGVVVGFDERVFEEFAVDFAELEGEAAGGGVSCFVLSSEGTSFVVRLEFEIDKLTRVSWDRLDS